jgi:hypothetical protein
MKQSRLMSLVESIGNIAVGFGLSLAAQWFFLPLIGVAIDFRQNLIFALIMTVISIARQFLLRRLFEALHIRRPLSPAMQAVIEERYRQIEAEGWSIKHDDEHAAGDLALAGAGYALAAGYRKRGVKEKDLSTPPSWWPWSIDWWKPEGFRRDLVRAGALNLAELEKFDRSRSRGRAAP